MDYLKELVGACTEEGREKPEEVNFTFSPHKVNINISHVSGGNFPPLAAVILIHFKYFFFANNTPAITRGEPFFQGDELSLV
jgi:hypothetical protein